MLHNVISEGDNAAEWELCGGGDFPSAVGSNQNV